MVKSFKDMLKTLAVFCGAGPLIGLLIFAAGSALLAIGSGTKDGVWIFPFLLIYGVIFAHFAGIVWAALAAIISIALSFAMKRMPMWIGPAGGVISFLVSTQSKLGLVEGPILIADGQSPSAFGPAFALVVVATHVGAAWGSWVVAKRWIGR